MACVGEMKDAEGESGDEKRFDGGLAPCHFLLQMEYYSAIKKNTFESVLMRWMKLE